MFPHLYIKDNFFVLDWTVAIIRSDYGYEDNHICHVVC